MIFTCRHISPSQGRRGPWRWRGQTCCWARCTWDASRRRARCWPRSCRRSWCAISRAECRRGLASAPAAASSRPSNCGPIRDEYRGHVTISPPITAHLRAHFTISSFHTSLVSIQPRPGKKSVLQKNKTSISLQSMFLYVHCDCINCYKNIC